MNRLITFFLLFLLSILFLHPFEGGGDFYHHVNTGKQIIEQGTFPFTDIYTHTAEGKEWIAYAWGSGIILYLIFESFGPIGISVLVYLTGAVTILLLYYLLRLSSISKSISLIAILLSLGPILTRFPNRPEIFTYPLILLILIINNIRTKYPRAALFFPLIILAWSNLYGSSTIAGIGLIALLTIKQLTVDKFKIRADQKIFYLVSLVSCLASLINPNTYKSVFYMFLYIPKVAGYEGEWAGIWTVLNYTPDSYLLLYQYLFLIYFIYLAVFLIITLLSVKRIFKNIFLLLLSLAVIVPIFAFRHLPLAALLSIPLMALMLKTLKSRILIGIVILASIFMISIMLWLKPIGVAVDTSTSDHLINFLKQNNISGKAFNHSTTGSFLSYSLYPQVKVFFDTRDDLFKDSPAFDDLYQSQMTSGSIMPLLDKYQIDVVIADFFTDSLNYKDLFNSSKWSVIYFNDRYIVAVPASVAKEKKLASINDIDPFSPTGSKPGTEAAAEDFYRTTMNASPTNSNKLSLVQTLLAQDNYFEAVNILKTLEISKDPTVILLKKQRDYFLAKSYIYLKDCPNAKFYLGELEKDLTGNFIFNPSKKLQVIDEDLKALYYRGCEHDVQKGDDFMKQYLNRRDVNPKEKIKFQIYYQSSKAF